MTNSKDKGKIFIYEPADWESVDRKYYYNALSTKTVFVNLYPNFVKLLFRKIRGMESFNQIGVFWMVQSGYKKQWLLLHKQ